MTTYPTFDPNAPKTFEALSLREEWDMRDSNPKAHKRYMAEKAKYEKWRQEQERKRMQRFNPLMNIEDHYTSRRERDEINLMISLGKAVEAEGFTVKWYAHEWQRDYTVHPTWARAADLYRDNLKVGSFRLWKPSGGYRYHAVGWVIVTNRGVGNPNAKWGSSREEKRLKKLESAVKYIKETAVPELDFEADIERYREQITALRVKRSNLNGRVSELQRGQSRYGSDDGLLRQLLEAQAKGDETAVWTMLKERNDYIQLVADQASDLEAEAQRIETEQLEPLLQKAREQLPEFYES